MYDPHARRKYDPWCRVLLSLAALAAGMVFVAWMDFDSQDAASGNAEGEPAVAQAQNRPTLDDLVSGKLAIVDLSWPLSDKNAYWPGDNYKPFELHTIATLDEDGVLSKAFSSPEHLGTHLDAPNHFERGQPSVDQIPPRQHFAPGILIDVSGAASADADYLVSLADVRDWEKTHGKVPTGSVVLAYTGWSRFWENLDRYQNRDVMSRLHFPGFSPEAVKFLLDERQVRGVGLDTMSVDNGLSRDFAVHHLLGKAECYGLENLSQLDKLPAKSFWLVVAPMKIETGSGGPARVFAILPATTELSGRPPESATPTGASGS